MVNGHEKTKDSLNQLLLPFQNLIQKYDTKNVPADTLLDFIDNIHSLTVLAYVQSSSVVCQAHLSFPAPDIRVCISILCELDKSKKPSPSL